VAEAGLDGSLRDALGVALGLVEGPPADRLTVASAVLALLRQAAAASPLLLVVDDLQWLDRSTAAVLGLVARRLAGTPAGFLAASRSADEGFFERGDLPRHEIRPLDEAAAAGLIGARFPALADRVRQRLLAEAQGNPLALLELSAALSGPQRAAAQALPAVLPLGGRLQALFASRVSDLPAPARRLLLLAVLDGTGDLGLLRAAVAGRREFTDLAAAERAGLVRVDGATGRLAFRHPLTRSAIMEMSASDERRAAHRAIAGQLADQPERRAWHLGEAAVEPDEQIAGLLEQTAQRILRRGDAVGAVAALLRAAELSPRRLDRSRRMALAAYIGADVAGDLKNVAQLLDDAAAPTREPADRWPPRWRPRTDCSTATVTSTPPTGCWPVREPGRPPRHQRRGLHRGAAYAAPGVLVWRTDRTMGTLLRRPRPAHAAATRRLVPVDEDLRRPGARGGPGARPARRRRGRPGRRVRPGADRADRHRRRLRGPAGRLPRSPVASGPRGS